MSVFQLETVASGYLNHAAIVQLLPREIGPTAMYGALSVNDSAVPVFPVTHSAVPRTVPFR